MSVVVFNSVVNYGQFVCYKKRPTSRANNSGSFLKLPICLLDDQTLLNTVAG